MSWDELEEKKAMRMINIVIDIIIAGISFIIGIALWLTYDFVVNMYASYYPLFPSMPGLQGVFIAIMIAQIAGGTSIIIRSLSRILKTLMKAGRP